MKKLGMKKIVVGVIVLVLLCGIGWYSFSLTEENLLEYYENTSYNNTFKMKGTKGYTKYSLGTPKTTEAIKDYKIIVEIEVESGTVNKIEFVNTTTGDKEVRECESNKAIKEEVVFDKVDGEKEIEINYYVEEGTVGVIKTQMYGKLYGYQKILRKLGM